MALISPWEYRPGERGFGRELVGLCWAVQNPGVPSTEESQFGQPQRGGVSRSAFARVSAGGALGQVLKG